MSSNMLEDQLNISEYMKNVDKFKENVKDLGKTWEQLILLSQLSSSNINMDDTKADFDSLSKELSKQLSHETLKKVTSEMASKAQVTVDIVIRNLFERTADIGFLATDNDVRDFILDVPSLIKKIKLHENDEDDTQFITSNMRLNERVSAIRERFEEYVAKYSVYYDILLFDKNKRLLTKMVDNNKIKQSNDEALELARTTSDDYVETYKKHDFLPHLDDTLVYTYKVTESDTSKDAIGFLSLCFKFENEMEGIFKNLVDKKNKEVLLLLDKSGNVLASSDKHHIPENVKLETNLEHDYKITEFAGRDYLIKTCETNGYEGFYGLGWLGHIMIPLQSAFNVKTQDIKLEKEVLNSIMQNENLYGNELLAIPPKAQDIQDQLDSAVWNGNLIKVDDEGMGSEFTRTILREIKNSGEKTKESFSKAIEKLNQTIISSLLDNVDFLASLSIDIMDRNLYERANDCRWWALTASFRDILSKDQIEQKDYDKLESVLKYINNLYTVYTNLFVYDLEGRVLAVSNDEDKKFVGTKLSEKWIKKSLNLKETSEYAVSFFEQTPLYDNEFTYIYSAAIKNEKKESIGGIGVVFDSKDQFKDMLKDALPSENEKIKEGFSSIFVEKKSKKIVNSSNGEFEIGKEFSIDPEFFELRNGESLSKITKFNDKLYIVGAKCSSGYREYKSSKDSYENDVLAFVFIEAGEIIEAADDSNAQYNSEVYKYDIQSNEEFIEVATFFIGDKWLGIDVEDVLETMSINNLEPLISMEEEKHFKGTTLYKSYVVSVLDIYSFIKTKTSVKPEDYQNIVLAQYKGESGQHRLGLCVSSLGDIFKVPKRNIKKIDSHFIDGGVIGESIIAPPDNVESKSLLTLLNISKLETLDTRTVEV